MVQGALSFVLVFGAGLFLRSFSRLARRDLGFTSENILLVNLDAQRSATPPAQSGAAGVERMVVASALRLAAIGLLAGAALSLWGSRFVGSLLWGLEARDTPTLALAAFTLAGSCLLASWLPARRAARVDPAQVLREG